MAIKKINNEVHHFKLGINALIEFEELSGTNLTEINEEMSIKDIRTLFFVSLKGAGSKVTLMESGNLLESFIEEYGIDDVGVFLSNLTEESLGKMSTQENLMKVTQ